MPESKEIEELERRARQMLGMPVKPRREPSPDQADQKKTKRKGGEKEACHKLSM